MTTATEQQKQQSVGPPDPKTDRLCALVVGDYGYYLNCNALNMDPKKYKTTQSLTVVVVFIVAVWIEIES